MTALADSYLNVAEAAALLAARLPAADERLVAFTALNDAQKAVCLVQATADLDAVLWLGVCSEGDQPHAWPRTFPNGANVTHRGVGTLPSESSTDWSFPDIPFELRVACAIQAGRKAIEARGFDTAREARDHAGVGVTSRGGAGQSVSVDLTTANSPWARIDPDAKAAAGKFRTIGGKLR